jgi:hypothetical protein
MGRGFSAHRSFNSDIARPLTQMLLASPLIRPIDDCPAGLVRLDTDRHIKRSYHAGLHLGAQAILGPQPNLRLSVAEAQQ